VKQAIYNARKEHCQQISSANPRLPGDTAHGGHAQPGQGKSKEERSTPTYLDS
jgi:hypothetical protein